MDPFAFSTAKHRLLEQIRNACSESGSHDAPRMIRCKVEVENVAAMQWLACQSIPIKTYWANRNQEFKMAGLGVAHEISGLETPDLSKLFTELRVFLDPKYPDLRYYASRDR
jgi:menaquinone-specific isochorismate synthase